MNYDYYKVSCSECQRKILIGVVLIGTNHNSSVIATCADCLTISPEFRQERPEDAEDIAQWLKGEA